MNPPQAPLGGHPPADSNRPDRAGAIPPPSGGADNLIDDLIEHNPSFRELLARSLAGTVEPFEPECEGDPSEV